MSELDFDNLLNEFDLDNNEGNCESKIDVNVEEYINNLDITNPDRILLENLCKANAILDRVIDDMNSGNFSARMAEVSSQIMSTISAMTSQLYKKQVDLDNSYIKHEMLKLKKSSAKIGGNTTNQNIILTDRESLLKFLKNENIDKIEYEIIDKE